MQERAKRPSRLVQSMARWAITLGAAGTLVGAIAMHGVWLRQEQVSSKYNSLVLSAVLLAVAFMLAPFVRQTFGVVIAKRQPPVRRTLLDELREEPDAAAGDADVVPEPAPTSSLAARLVMIAYLIFGVTLLVIVWALQER